MPWSSRRPGALTKQSLLAARREARLTNAEIIIRDLKLPGFFCRVQPPSRRNPEGYVSFGYRYRSADGHQRRAQVAEWHDGTDTERQIKSARTLAERWRVQARDGIDPAAVARRERDDRESADANTVQSVADRFFAEIGAVDDTADASTAGKRGKRRGKPLRTAKEVKRTLDRFLLAKFGERPIGSLTRRELIKLFDDIADANGPIAANRALAWAKRFFKWAVGKDHVDANPAADIVKPGEERKGDRVLTDAELRDVWAAASALPYPTGHYAKALLLTGRRRTSVATMRRSEIDATRHVWTPGGGTANKGAPELPLFTALEGILATIPEQETKGGDYVFSTRQARDTALNSFTAVKDDLDAAIATARNGREPMPAWTLHDLRRTVKTRLAELGVPKEIRDLIMGHARQGMDAVYDHSERREDKRDGLERWGHALAAIIDPRPDNVVVLRA